MKLSFRHAIKYMAFVLGAISCQAGAAIDLSKGPLITNINEAPGRLVESLTPEAGALISIVLIALVVIARRINHHD